MTRIAFPSIDLSHFELPHFALPHPELPAVDDKVAAVARDAAYVAIGFGVLAFQRAQVRRRGVEKAVSGIVRSLAQR